MTPWFLWVRRDPSSETVAAAGRGSSLGGRLVNTCPTKPRTERGSKLGVFVWVYYDGFFFFKFVNKQKKEKKKKFLVFASQRCLGAPLEVACFLPFLCALLSSCPFSAFVLNFVGVERRGERRSQPGRARAAAHFCGVSAPRSPPVSRPNRLAPDKEREGKWIFSGFYDEHSHPRVPLGTSRPVLIPGVAPRLSGFAILHTGS